LSSHESIAKKIKMKIDDAERFLAGLFSGVISIPAK
jgi:hypothetical protein